MIWRTALKTLFLTLPIGISGPVFAEGPAVTRATPVGTDDIIAVFQATCGSGETSSTRLQQSFEAQGFETDWLDDTYGYFTQAGFTASYHIYPGSWTCFVSSEGTVVPDVCDAFSANGMEEQARLADGTCVFNKPEHGLTVLVRNICPDSSYGTCTWVQATLTAERDCRAGESVDLASLPRIVGAVN